MMDFLGVLFEEAKKYGIKRAEIGREVFGESQYARVYITKNPTQKMVERFRKGVNNLIERKKNEKIVD